MLKINEAPNKLTAWFPTPKDFRPYDSYMSFFQKKEIYVLLDIFSWSEED